MPALFIKNLRPYPLRVWINNAGLGDYHSVSEQDLAKLQQMLHLNVEALAILSTLFVKDYKDISGTQLINVSSCGGYTIVPNAVTYCATKYFVSAFTEGLAAELKAASLPMSAKVFAPAATQTAFGQIANDVSAYDYNQAFSTYHSAKQAAEFLLALYDSDQTVGFVDRETFAFHLSGPRFAYAGCSQHNQKNCPPA